MEKILIHPDYSEYLDDWQQCRVFCEGRHKVRDYLNPVVPASAPNAAERNATYRKRAKYFNFPGRTRNGFSGMVFRKPPSYELPDALAVYESNITGSGESITQLSKSLVSNLIETGRHGLYVDYLGEGDAGRPIIKEYRAELSPYWDTDDQKKLTYVRLKKGDGYKDLLLIDGVYIVHIVDNKGNIVEQYEPRQANGASFDFIPFVYAGSVNNNPDVDDIPIWSIVDLTQGHYQNSAEYEDILRFMLPTVAATVPSRAWLNDVTDGNGYSVGSGAVLPIPPDGGDAKIIQANDNQMHERAMRHKEDILVALGAQMITPKTGAAEANDTVRLRFSSESSVLDDLVGNASEAIKNALQWCCLFVGADTELVTFELNREYWDYSLSPQQIAAIIMLQDRGDIGKSDARDLYRKGRILSEGRTDEDIDAEVSESGMGL